MNAELLKNIIILTQGKANLTSIRKQGYTYSQIAQAIAEAENKGFLEMVDNRLLVTDVGKEYVEKAYAGSGIDIYKTYGELYTEQLKQRYVNDETGCSTLAEFYNKLLNDAEFRAQFGLSSEDVSTMDPNGDPAKELLVMSLRGQYTREYAESLFDKKYVDVVLEELLKQNKCTTINEYFDKLV